MLAAPDDEGRGGRGATVLVRGTMCWACAGAVVASVLAVTVLVMSGSGVQPGGWAGSGGSGRGGGPAFTVNDYTGGVLGARAPQFQWVAGQSDAILTTFSAGDGVVAVGPDGASRVLLAADSPLLSGGSSVEGLTVSPDGSMLLVATQSTRLYRHSSLAVYATLPAAAAAAAAQAESAAPAVTPVLDGILLRIAVWAPSPSDPLTLAVVDAGSTNIALVDVVSGTASWITHDGALTFVLNGVPDWVYEEEVFAGDTALWWAPAGLAVAFLKTNESAVPVTGFDVYSQDSPYPARYSYKYPVPGSRNSDVSLWVAAPGSAPLRVPLDMVGEAELVTWVGWTDTESLLVRVSDRAQTMASLYMYNSASGDMSRVSRIVSPAWIEPHDSLIVFPGPDPAWAVDLQPRGDDLALALVALDGSSPDAPDAWLLSKPGTRVVRALAVSPLGDAVFFIAAPSPTSRVLAVVEGISPTHKSGTGVVVLTPPGSDGRSWVSASFAPDRAHAVVVDEASGVPVYSLVSVAVASPWLSMATPVTVLEANTQLRAAMARLDLPQLEYMTVPSRRGDGPEARNNAYMLKPPGFDARRAYPVLMYQYSGPGSQLVTDSHRTRTSWLAALASSHDIVVVCVDGIGTGGRGLGFMQATYESLGTLELGDQIAAAEYVASLPYVDAQRIGLFGWSFGGFMAASALVSPDASVYSAIISVAPVTDWRWYDSIYTERYMGTLSANQGGYTRTSVVNAVATHGVPRPDTPFLLVAGLADDNVRYQHTAALDAALVDAGFAFDGFAYPNQAHGINSGPGAHAHVYAKLTAWLLDNL